MRLLRLKKEKFKRDPKSKFRKVYENWENWEERFYNESQRTKKKKHF